MRAVLAALMLAAGSLVAVATPAPAAPPLTTAAASTRVVKAAAVHAAGLPSNCTVTVPLVVSCVWNYAGYPETWTVPSGVTTVSVVAIGARGGDGNGSGSSSGGNAGAEAAQMLVYPGESLQMEVGSQGASSQNGGAGGWPDGGAGGNDNNVNADGCGGGGSTAIYDPSTSPFTPLVVAGGGGGCGGAIGYTAGTGGYGGSTPAGGTDGDGIGGSCHYGGFGGGPGSNPVGGAEGTWLNGTSCDGGGETFSVGGGGSSVRGGQGGQGRNQDGTSGGGGGGGGGYVGGGGGGGGNWQYFFVLDAAGSGGAGGGGLNYVATNGSTFNSGAINNSPPPVNQGGNGQVDVTYQMGTSTTTLFTSPSTQTVGGPVSLNVGVNSDQGNPVGGTVSISDSSGGPITACQDVPVTAGTVSTGVARCTWTPGAAGAHSLTATFNGNGGVTGSSAPVVSYTVDANPTSLTVSAPGTHDGSFSATATVSSTSSWAMVGGTVGFSAKAPDGSTVALCPSIPTTTPAAATVTATCSISAGALRLAPGTAYEIDANYQPGDGTTTASSGSTSLTTSAASTTTSVSSSDSSVSYGATVTYTATVAAIPAAPFGGTVTFYRSTGSGPLVALCAGSPVGTNGSVTCKDIPPAGQNTVSASYTGDAKTQPSSSAVPASVSVGQRSVVGSLAPSQPSPTLNGTNVTITATLGVADGPAPSGGTVAFAVTQDTQVGPLTLSVCPAAPVSGGQATCSWTPTAGSYTFSASYTGDANDVATSAFSVPAQDIPYKVTANASTTTLAPVSPASLGTPVAAGTPVTVGATVAPVGAGGIPTGTVAFFDNGQAICSASPPALSNGIATCTWTPAAKATHKVTASYGGDTNDAPSASSVLSFQMAGTPSTTVLTASPSQPVYGQTVSLSAAVTAAGAPVGDGTVAFSQDGQAIPSCTAVSVTAGAATCTIVPSGGPHSFTASFAGGSVTGASSAGPTALSVAPDPTAVALAERPGTSGTVLSATVSASSAGGAQPGSPVGAVTITVGGSPPSGCSALPVPAGAAMSVTVSCTATLAAGSNDLEATFAPTNVGEFSGSSASQTYTPPATCSPGFSSIWNALGGTLGLQRTNSAIGADLMLFAGPSGACDPNVAVAFTATGTLFHGSLGLVNVSGTISQDGGICLTTGSLSLPSSWGITDPTITVPVCFALSTAGGIGVPTSGVLTTGSQAMALPFVHLPGVPATSLTVTFGASDVTIDFAAGNPTSTTPSADLTVAIDGTGTYTGTLTTQNLTVFGHAVALSGSITGSGGAVPTVTASATLGQVALVAGVTLTGVTVTAANTGLTVTASASFGGTVPLAVTVTGTVADPRNWTLNLTTSGDPWTPFAGLTVSRTFTGTVTDTAGTIGYQLTAGSTNQAAVTWSPGAGVNLALTTISLGSTTTACDGGTIAGSGDPLLNVAGTVAIGGNGAALTGCVDLANGAFQLGATADNGIDVVNGFTLDGLTLSLTGGAHQGATLSGNATATVTAAGTPHAIPVALQITSAGTLAVAGSVDLSSFGAPITGYVAYASADIQNFAVDPQSTTTIALPAGVSAQGSYTPSANTAALLSQAGFTLSGGGTISFLAALSPAGAVTFNAQLAAPSSLPFLTLPGGASLNSATLSWSAGKLDVAADASVPVPGAASPADVSLAASIDTTTGDFAGSGTVTGLQILGQPVNLTGSITGVHDTTTGKDAITSKISGTITGPFSAGPPTLTLSDLGVTLGTDGVDLHGTLSVASVGSITVTGAFTSFQNWSLTATGTASQWTPNSSVTIDGTIGGTLTDTAGAITYDLSASPTVPGGDVASFTPTPGVTLGIGSVELSNGPGLPTGCTIGTDGDSRLAATGNLAVTLAGHSLQANATGCFDLTSHDFSLSAGLGGTISAFNGNVTVSAPTVTITKTASGFAVGGTANLTVQMPTGGTLSATVTLDYEGAGDFVVGAEVNLSQWLGGTGTVAYLYYATKTVSGFDTGDPTLQKITLVPGVTFAVDVSLPASADTALKKIGLNLPNGGTIAAIGTLDFATGIYSLKLQFDFGIAGQTLFSTPSGLAMKLDSGYLKLTLGGGQVAFAMGLVAEMDLPALYSGSLPSTVPLIGEISFSPTELDASLSVGDCNDATKSWHDALGIPGLVVKCASVQGGISLEGEPFPSFGFSGTITGLPTVIANAIGYVNNAPISFAFNLDPILLAISIGTQDSGTPALEPLAAFGKPDLVQVDYASLYVAPTAATVGQTTYPAGFGLGFQGVIAGVNLNILAQIDPTAPSLKFVADVSQINVGALSIGPVAVDLEASPTHFSFTLDASIALGPGSVSIGPALQVGGYFNGSVHASLSTSGLDFTVAGGASVTISTYDPKQVCYEYGFLPYPCDYQWDTNTFGFTLQPTGFAIDSSGLTLTWNGHSITLPWPSPSSFSGASVSAAGDHSTRMMSATSSAANWATTTSGGLSAGGGPRYVLAAVTQPARAAPANPFAGAGPPPFGGTVAGGWNPTGSLGTGRAFAASAELSDGEVLVAGGGGPAGVLNTAELWNPHTGAWSPTGSMHEPRAGATATVLADGRVLVAGGRTAAGPTAGAEIYDPSTGTWSQVGGLHQARAFATASRLGDGTVLVAGGIGGGGPLASAELFHPATGQWSTTGALAQARGLHTATVLADGTVLVAGGQGADGPLASAEVFHPSSGRWTATAGMGSPRFMASAVRLANGSVLVSGDAANGEVYNPATGRWAVTGAEPESRTLSATSLLADGRVLVAGGLVAGAPTADTEVYDPATNQWSAAAPLRTAASSPAVTVEPGGDVLVAGGLGTGTAVSAAELFAPPGSRSPASAAPPTMAHQAAGSPVAGSPVAGSPAAPSVALARGTAPAALTPGPPGALGGHAPTPVVVAAAGHPAGTPAWLWGLLIALAAGLAGAAAVVLLKRRNAAGG